MTFRPEALAACLAVLLVGACAGAPVRWENPDLPRDRWPRDAAACRVRATTEAERDYARDPVYRNRDDRLHGNPALAGMARFDAVKRRNALFARCMRARGYRAVKKGGGA